MRPRAFEPSTSVALGPSEPPASPVAGQRLEPARYPCICLTLYPFNAQFPYNLTLRSKRNFAKSFSALGGGCERDAHIRVLEIKCWAKLVTLRLSISKPIRSKVCAKMTSKGNHTLGWRRARRPRRPHT